MEIAITSQIHISLRREIFLNFLIYVVWAAMLHTYLRGIFIRIPFFKDNVEIAFTIYFATPVLLALPSLINKFSLGDYCFYLINVFYLLANYAFFPENTEYLNENVLICIFCVFPFYFIGRIIDIEKSYHVFLILSTICIIVDLLYFLVYAQNHKNMQEVAGSDNMYSAYLVLPHVTFMLWATLRKFRIWKAIITFLGIMFLLSCGTRGPLVCVGFFGIIYFFFYMRFKGAIYVKLGLIALSSILIANLQSAVLFLAKLFTGLQLSTRILEKFITGELGNDSYRSVLRDKLYSVVNDGEHFLGLGVFGCRNYDIIYPHFLPLDLACTYGNLVGYTLLVLLTILIAWAFYTTRGKINQEFLLYLFSICIIKLFLSGSFIIEPYFFLLIGVCIKEILYSHTTLSETTP